MRCYDKKSADGFDIYLQDPPARQLFGNKSGQQGHWQ